MKTTNLGFSGSWKDVVNACRVTVGKEAIDHEPSDEFKTNILISEHSPIRMISIRWSWNRIKSWIATHWSRHKWECYIKTQRSDRTGVKRDDMPQDRPVNFTGYANPQHLIDTMRKRLCRQASDETREYAEDFKATIHGVKEMEQISDVLVPNCVYRCGCPETLAEKPCAFWPAFRNWCIKKAGTDPALMPIKQRYVWYNEWFYEHRREHHE